MDFSLPIAARTRRREEEMYKKWHAEIKKKRKREEREGHATESLKLDLEHPGSSTSKSESSAAKDSKGKGIVWEAASMNRVVLDGSEDDCVYLRENSGDDIEGKDFILIRDNEDSLECSHVGENIGLNSTCVKSEPNEVASNHCSGTNDGTIETVGVEELSSGIDGRMALPLLSEKSGDHNRCGDDDPIVISEDSSEERESSSSEDDEDDYSDDNDYNAERSDSFSSDEDESSEEEEEEEIGRFQGIREFSGRKSDDKKKSEKVGVNSWRGHMAARGERQTGETSRKIIDWVRVDTETYKEDGESLETKTGGDRRSGKKVDSFRNFESAQRKSNIGGSSCQPHIDDIMVLDDSSDVCRESSHKVLHTKRRRASALKDCEVVQILADTILLNNAELPFEELDELAQPTLPRNFTFAVEKPLPPEKTEEDKAMEALWAEMQMCQCGDSAVDGSIVVDEVNTLDDSELDAHTLCAQGKHRLVMDEEIGLKCKFCSYIDCEIRHCVAPFHTDPRGRADRREPNIDKFDFFGDIGSEYFTLESQGSDPCSVGKRTVWDLIPGIRKGMHPHQLEGLEFLWKNIAGGIYLDDLKQPSSSSSGSGCIISHAPGTGKTRLAIAFICLYMKWNPACQPLIIAPCGMLLNWQAEFKKWGCDIPFHNLNDAELSGKEDAEARKLLIRAKIERPSDESIRLVKLLSWQKEKSVLVMSYQLFAKLIGERKNRSTEVARKVLLEHPGLLVLDEGHIARNEDSQIYEALSRIKTDKRIFLSGTPFQNSMEELFNTLNLARPKFAEMLPSRQHKIYPKKCGRRNSKANWASLTNPIGKDGDYKLDTDRLEEVRAIIRPFVHVHKGTILEERLPGLRDSVIILQPEGFQEGLINKVGNLKKNYFLVDKSVSLVCVHPSLLSRSPEMDKLDIDWNKLGRTRSNPETGVKTKFVMELIWLCQAINERVLIFSRLLDPLTLIMDYLISRFKWCQGRELLYMDGKLGAKERQSLIKNFNDARSEAKVMLASTKACCEGISLVGASRVVLLDVLWNPSVVRQAISRAYRLGQEKIVYVYNLIAAGSLEGDKYLRQAQKERLSELVFHSADGLLSHQEMASEIADGKTDKVLEEMVQRQRLKGMFKQIIYEPKESNLLNSLGFQDL